jgi:hypothetical protein
MAAAAGQPGQEHSRPAAEHCWPGLLRHAAFGVRRQTCVQSLAASGLADGARQWAARGWRLASPVCCRRAPRGQSQRAPASSRCIAHRSPTSSSAALQHGSRLQTRPRPGQRTASGRQSCAFARVGVPAFGRWQRGEVMSRGPRGGRRLATAWLGPAQHDGESVCVDGGDERSEGRQQRRTGCLAGREQHAAQFVPLESASRRGEVELQCAEIGPRRRCLQPMGANTSQTRCWAYDVRSLNLTKMG